MFNPSKAWLQDGEPRFGGVPAVKRRVINHWDNPDGSVERGYAGRSIFFKGGALNYDEGRVSNYARLLSSIGINEISINNVNVQADGARLILDAELPAVAKLAAIFRQHGVRLLLSVNFESPRIVGGLDTCDPLDAGVTAWWAERVTAVYKHIPDFGGFLVKADSEFRGGPASLGRTQADGANMLARALKPYGGVLYWRCFIYNCKQDWRDTTVDRPKAAYDLFMPQDGLFDDNVILQVKNGPSDFQVKEPNSPLLGAMKHTKQCLEFQISQEYTGQQVDLFYLGRQWGGVLSFPAPNGGDTADLFGNEIAAVSAVANVGDDDNITGHLLAQANLFAFGALAWNPKRSADEIAREWARLTFGGDERVTDTVVDMLTRSTDAYARYASNLGLGWCVNINHHYGPSPDGYEFMRWGTYHRANHAAVGVDRTERGTGFVNQYAPDVAALFSDPTSCPDELLLYFHRLPYSFKMKDGRTLLQRLYDDRFDGAETVEDFIKRWDAIKDKLPAAAYDNVAERLRRQSENAAEWRDVCNTFFYRLSGIPDERGRKIYE